MNLSPDQLLPQRDTMQLIDNIIDINDEFARCDMQVRDTNIFYDPQIKGIYAWVGIELMAQAVALYAGFQSPGDKPNIGLLLSVRQYKLGKTQFSADNTLIIQANKVYLEDNVGVFNCEIFHENKRVASARLNTYLPPEEKLQKILRGNNQA